MAFARKVWKLLVALKDGLALLFLLLFFLALYAVLSARPGPGIVREGALTIDLSGYVVEEPSIPDPLSLLLSGQAPVGEHRARDVVRALELAASDERISAVVLDLRGFLGGGFVHMQDIGDAMEIVRAADKPVLAYGTAMLDDATFLAGHASEAWVDPNGGAFIQGPGGNSLYYGRLLENLEVDAKVYRAGTYKSAVEPYILNEPSPASREAYEAIYGAIWDAWRADYRKARPRVDLDLVTGDPVAWVEATGGDVPRAALAAGMIDRIGTPTQFFERVAEIAGEAPYDDDPGAYAKTDMRTLLGAYPLETPGRAIGVVTIAGNIVDGDAGPGSAGGDRIVDILNRAYDEDLAALVLRIDSPGGSIVASEHVRVAVERIRAKGVPVVASMANLGASGGYWVATPAQAIFAEPGTITGSIGVFSVVPMFDRALAEIGVSAAGVKTTPLSGQPDPLGGFTPEVDRMLQLAIDSYYDRFLTLVAKSRKLNKSSAQAWAEGRPWAGGDARQLQLIDRFGGLDEALAYAAGEAGLEDGGWHVRDLGGQPDTFGNLLRSLQQDNASTHSNDLAGLAAARQEASVRGAIAGLQQMMTMRGAQALCLECPGALQPPRVGKGDPLRDWLAAAAERVLLRL